MRKALSPVITTVLLVVISVALALSAATFITDTQGKVSDRLTEAVQEDIELESVSCNGRTARFRISNSGSQHVEMGRADFRVYKGATLNESFTKEDISVDGSFTNANSEGVFNVTTPSDAVFRSGEQYTLELFFSASDFDMSAECVAGERWWNLNWEHRRQIRVSGSGETTASVTMDTATLIEDNKMRDNCEDIRIVDDMEVRNHSIPSGNPCNSGSTVVEFQTTIDGSTDYDTYIYYGNNLANARTGTTGAPTATGTLMQEENRSDY